MTRSDDRDEDAAIGSGPKTVHAGLALALCSLLLVAGAQAQPVGAPDRLSERKASAVSRACRWLASQQSPDGSLTSPGQHLNVNVWETALSLVALLRCDPSAYGGVIAKGFEFLDANWIEAGGLPESVVRDQPVQIACVETTAPRCARMRRRQARSAEKLRDSSSRYRNRWRLEGRLPEAGWCSRTGRLESSRP